MDTTKSPTLSPLIATYVAGRQARREITPDTADNYRVTLRTLDRSFGARPLKQFGPRAIDRWIESVGHLAASTRHQYISRVRKFCTWLLRTRRIALDPTAHVEPIEQPRRVPVTLTHAQVADLLHHVRGDRRALAVVWIMVGCAARCIEVANLRVEDYDPVGLSFVLRGKGQHERHIPVPVEVSTAVNAYLDEVGIATGPLIRSRRTPSEGLSRRTIGWYVRRWMRDAGVKARALDGRSAHGLRRTAASDVMEHTNDIRVVQELLGHAKVETTARHYLRPVTVEQMREAMAGRRYDQAA